MADTTERDALAIGQALHDAGSVLDAAIVGRDASPQERRDALRALRAAMFNWRRFKATLGAHADIVFDKTIPAPVFEHETPDERFTPIRFYEPDPCESESE